MRAVTGDLGMTTADFRSSATGSLNSTPPPDAGPNVAPEITSLTAAADGEAPADTGVAGEPPSFHPNGDGLDDVLVVTHTVTRDATLNATVTNAAGDVVSTFSLWSRAGTSTSHWNGRNASGAYVPDGLYELTYVPRGADGSAGSAVSTEVLVLTAIKLAKPSAYAFYSADRDRLSKRTRLAVTLNQSARITWQIQDAAGNTVRTLRSNTSVGAGTIKLGWNGTDDSGAFVPDGFYSSVVSATTSLGSYSQERQLYVGAFRVKPLTAQPQRGKSVTLTLLSTEPLKGSAKVRVSQPGFAAYELTTKRITSKKFKVTLNLASGGDAGDLQLLVSGTDKYSGQQQTSLSLPLS